MKILTFALVANLLAGLMHATLFGSTGWWVHLLVAASHVVAFSGLLVLIQIRLAQHMRARIIQNLNERKS